MNRPRLDHIKTATSNLGKTTVLLYSPQTKGEKSMINFDKHYNLTYEN